MTRGKGRGQKVAGWSASSEAESNAVLDLAAILELPRILRRNWGAVLSVAPK